MANRTERHRTGVFGLLRVDRRIVALGAVVGAAPMFYISLLALLLAVVAVSTVTLHGLAVLTLHRDRVVTAWLLFVPAVIVLALHALVAGR